MADFPRGSLERMEPGSILEVIDAPAVLIGLDRHILAANRRYLEAFGGTERVLGRRCHEVSHGEALPCELRGETCPLQRCRDSGERVHAVHVHCGPDGLHHEEIVALPVLDTEGQVCAFVEGLHSFGETASARANGHRMVGRSPAFNRMLGMAHRAAGHMIPVLLLGESGTGKELLASAIHQLSGRASKPLVPVDCSALTETLFESELFGHERGAFTGASSRKTGLVEAAVGGTLFLDEVGDIPLPQQVKLLRLIETGVFRRVGGTELIRADFRLLCATHRNLRAMVSDGRFREDLYYRISVFPVELPPLRERLEDLPLLVESMLQEMDCCEGKTLTAETFALLQNYGFPGNIRELRNLIERACLLADGQHILPEHLPSCCRSAEQPIVEGPLPQAPGILPLSEVEAHYLAWAASHFTGEKRDLARVLGLSERSLYRKLAQLREPELA